MKKRNFTFLKTLILSAIFLAQTVFAQIPWAEWVTELRQEAIAEGISPVLFDNLFANIKAPRQDIHTLNTSQPEHRLTYPQYLNTRASRDRVLAGQRELPRYHRVLESIQDEFGVDYCIIVALWGMETSYGHYMGNFPTVQALATLAYQSNRPDFFRQELLGALQMLNNGDVSEDEFKGEWAGASGQCQFLPSSWYKYAVDYDGDGRKNIWTSVPDSLASIANYLRAKGWQTGEPVLMTAQLPSGFDRTYIETREKKTLKEWASLGVRQANGQPLPNTDTTAFVVNPDGGPVWLAFNNFQVILRYNNSIYYAGAIHYMAERICKR